jgi:multidrug efflux system membrane fusion protein
MSKLRARSIGFWATMAGTAIILAGTAHFVVGLNDRGAPWAAELPPTLGSPPIPVRTETVHLQATNDVSRYPAVVRPRIEADIGFRVGGKVVERFVDVAARLETGTKLARLDSADLELQAQAIESQLVSARADAANAQNDFLRCEQLVKAGWTTQQEYDRRKAIKETSEARVRQLEAQLRVALNNSQYALLVADGPGVVTAVLAEPGQVIAQGQAVFKIARLGDVEVAADVPEPTVVLLDKVRLSAELWSMPGIVITGRLRDVAPIADAATRTYRARVTLIDPPPETQLGMTATLVITQSRDGRIARLPRTALTKDGANPAMWVLNRAGDGIELRPVTIGVYADDAVTVMAGLNEGERVVTAGVHKLNATDKIRIWTEPER